MTTAAQHWVISTLESNADYEKVGDAERDAIARVVGLFNVPEEGCDERVATAMEMFAKAEAQATQITRSVWASLDDLPQWNIQLTSWGSAVSLAGNEETDAVVPGIDANDAIKAWFYLSEQDGADYQDVAAIPVK